jgi:biopolymer transport protein ExbB
MTSLTLSFVLVLLPGLLQAKETPRQGTPPQTPPAPAGPTAEELEAARQARIREGREALLRAYRKEYAFLDGEEKALEARLAGIAEDRRQRIGQAETEVKSFQERLSQLQDRLGAAKTALREAEEKGARLREEVDGTEATLSQAFASLERYGVKPLEGEDLKPGTPGHRDRSTAHVFAQAEEILGGLGSLRVVSERYFRPDGTPAEGKVLKVGGVAGLVVDGEVRGPLAPAGGGQMKLLSGAPPEAAAFAAPGSRVLPLFLYESAEKAVEEQQAQTWQQHVTAGGRIAWVIVYLGVAAALLLLVRAAILVSSASDARALLDRVTPDLVRGRFNDALAFAKRKGGAAARVLREALERPGASAEALETVLSERILREGLRLDRFDVAVMVSAAVAPLLGLLGTVTGMIATFDIITVYGTGDPKLLSGGISEALITTKLGLLVAIPILLGGSLLNGWSERIKSGLEHVALRLVHLREGAEAGDGSARGAGSGVSADAVEEREGEEDVAPAGARG